MILTVLCVTEHRAGRGGKVPYTALPLPHSFKITMNIQLHRPTHNKTSKCQNATTSAE